MRIAVEFCATVGPVPTLNTVVAASDRERSVDGRHELLTVDGETVEIRRSRRRTKTIAAHRENGRIIVLMPARLSADEQQRWVRNMVERVRRRERSRRSGHSDDDLMERGRKLLERHVWPHTTKQLAPTSIRWVSNQKRRWGSCTVETGAIRLSDRLQSFPDFVIDYVLVHELAHLYVADHTHEFWALVEHYPWTERARGFLEGWSTARNAPAGGGEQNRAVDDEGE